MTGNYFFNCRFDLKKEIVLLKQGWGIWALCKNWKGTFTVYLWQQGKPN